MFKTPAGLSEKEAQERLKEYGPNILPEKIPPSSLVLFLQQFKNPLVYILVAAGFVTIFLKDFSDTVIIFFVVIINSILGFVQEQKASNALQSLKAMIHPEVDVYRDGSKKTVNIENVVLGDIVELEQGNKVPADGKLISANRFLVEEAMLTGESTPVNKKEDDEVFMGTIVSSGEALMEVERTGADTQMGKIAQSVQKPQEDTPLTKQVKKFSNQLTVLVVILTAFVAVVGLLTGRETTEVFKTAVALAVSSIPEGLLIALTVVLAVGMQRILKKKGLVRNLVSAETLGGVTTICVDKTGTLTFGKLKVVDFEGKVDEICIEHFSKSDDPIMIATRKWIKENQASLKQLDGKLNTGCVLVDNIPFDPRNRYYATLLEHSGGNREIYVTGAPELILQWTDLSSSEMRDVTKRIGELTMDGKRVIGMAKKNAGANLQKISKDQIEIKLKWIGLIVFTDPVRDGVANSFKQTKKAGIKTIVITGDYAETASAVMNELKMEVSKERTILGSDLEKMSVEQVSALLKRVYRSGDGAVLFARTKPEQKLKVITALKGNGEVVAMMGDGVNDAPALHKADIGIVVGEATDVAKESADLVLIDSSFETIIEAIKEGRGIFDNIRKVILYLMSDAYEEIVAVILTIVFRLPLPVSAVQILWINIISDGFPHLALSVDPKVEGIMDRPPRSPKSVLISPWMKELIVIVSLSGGVIAYLLYSYYINKTGNYEIARSVAFATLGINTLIYVFSVRTLMLPFYKESFFNNKWLNFAVFAGMFFQVLPFLVPTLRDFFKLQPLGVYEWVSVFSASFIMFAIIELSKIIFHHLIHNRSYL